MMRKNNKRNAPPPKKRSTGFLTEKPKLLPRRPTETPAEETADTDMRLNKFLAHCGICSRRKAAELIQNGLVTVNDVVVTEIGIHVGPNDRVCYQGKEIKPETRLVYILLNKPKDTITTLSDEKGRRTVMDIVGAVVKERIYPVGRLDRDTTGLLLLTNDGELAKKLSHPSHKVKKTYLATLSRPLSKTDLDRIRAGVVLDDGPALVDNVYLAEDGPRTEVYLDIHIGKNRVVRRIFEHLGYDVERLDRLNYAGLTKKDLPRGRFRHLTQREIIMLKHFT